MQRKRNELVPIGEAFRGLEGPEKKALQPSPQARHHFTLADQVNQLGRGQRSGPRSGLHGAERWRCAHCPAPTPATGFFTSGSTAPSRSTCKPSAGSTNFPFGQPSALADGVDFARRPCRPKAGC